MMFDARVRLEGRLELIEHDVEALRAATRVAAGRHEFQALLRAVERDNSEELGPAEEAVRRMSAHEPGLMKIIDALDAARWSAAKVVVERAGLLHVPSMPLHEAVRALADEPVRFEADVMYRWGGVAAVPLITAAAFTSTNPRGGVFGFVLLVTMLAFVVLGTLLSAVGVRVTSRRLFIAGQTISLSSVRDLKLERTMRKSWPPVRAIVTRKDGTSFETWLPAVPRPLIEALEASGVKVDVVWSFW